MKTFLLVILTLVVNFAWATDECEKAAASVPADIKDRSNFKVIPSDRVPSESEKYAAYVRTLTEPGGVLDQLGIDMTGQIVEFLQGRDLNAVTSGTAGGYPIAHYLDGASVLRSLKPKTGFALEVVFPGSDYQHGFYRDDNKYEQQISIIDHVVGHNNFAYASGFPHYRAGQGLVASRKLDRLMQDLYANHNKDEVQRFYLFAQTLMPLLDWYVPYFQESKDFEPSLEVSRYDPLGRTKQTIRRHPKAPTENILQAFAANLAPHEPEWKRQILDYMANAMAFRPALVHTQILNEGWASIMQEILPRFTKDNHNLTFWLNASQVMQSEAKPNLRDPYSLGVFAWRRLMTLFMQRPEIKAMATPVEKMRAFIRYANDDIIGRMDDAQFLRLALDQPFVDQFNLAVVRRAEDNEQDPNMPPPPYDPNDPTPKAQWIVVSRDHERVAQSIIDTVIKPKYQWNPRIKLVDFTRPNSGEVELIIDDEFGSSMAMEKETLGAALYSMTSIIRKSVSLECNLVATSIEWVEDNSWGGWWGPRPEPRRIPRATNRLAHVRVTASETGEIRVYAIDDKGGEKLDEELTKEISTHFKEYITDLYLEDDEELGRLLESSQTLRDIKTQAIASMIEDTPYDSLVSHSPNAAGAILEYKQMLDRRLLKAMERAMKTKNGIKVLGGKARIRALPQIINFSFDMEYAQQAIEGAPKAPIDLRMLNKTVEHRNELGQVIASASALDDGGRVGELNGNPGDRFWGPGDGQGGGQSGPKPGEDPNDLSWVEIPQDLYSKFLGERVKLPILNRKPGLSRTKKFKAGRRINRMNGQALPTEIMDNAYKRGFGKALVEGRDPYEDTDRIFEDGFANLMPRDWVVKSKTIARRPDVKAAVVFVLDASGSTAAYMESFKRFVHDIQTLIKTNYKGFAFRYVVFDTEAHVMKDETEFFRAELGGGTQYTAGIDKAKWLFEQDYPRSSWDRYTFLMGDMQDFSPAESFQRIKGLLEESEFFGTVAGIGSPEWAEYLELLRDIQSEIPSNPAVGLTILDEDGGYRIENIREVLRNEDE